MSGPHGSLERVGTSGAGVPDSYELPMCLLETNSRSSARATNIPTHRAISPSHDFILKPMILF